MQVWWNSNHWFKRYRANKKVSRPHRRSKINTLRPPVTLKVWSKSPKLNQPFGLSQWCILASMVKFHPLIQEIWWIRIVMLTPMPGIRTETNISPPHLWWGNIIPKPVTDNCPSSFSGRRNASKWPDRVKWPDRLSNPGRLALESDALPTATSKKIVWTLRYLSFTV